MKFGFEHDRDELAEEESEQTPLLSAGNVAPASDPKAALAVQDIWSSASTSSFNEPSNSQTAQSPPSTPATEQSFKEDEKPLPKQQVLLLCLARLVEPIAFFSIFPFINQMCAKNGNLPPSDTGFWSGLIESLFSLTQMSVMILWGRLSDRFGRKPILVISLVGVGIATATFGLAQTLWQMILFRCLAGVFAGTVVTIRTMCTEHSTSKTQARIFSWFAFSGNLGILFGPLIGGALADPAKQYGRAFKGVRFFEHYPYALATIATGSIAIIAAVLTSLFVEETLPSRSKPANQNDSDRDSEALLDERTTETDVNNSTWSLIKAPGVLPVLYLYGHVMLLAFCYTAIVPVLMYEPVRLGGFEFSSLLISLSMALIGLAQAAWLLLVFPPLQHRIGTGGVLRACAYAYPWFFAVPPLLNLLLRQGSHTARIIFFVMCPILLSIGVGVSMAFTAIQLALNDVAPSQQTLGTLNALALTVVSGIRAFSPAAATSIFAIGVREQILWGYLAWLVLFVLATGFSFAIRWLPEKAEGRIYKKNNATENYQRDEGSSSDDQD
ncbi:hypothetical protein H2198_003365 [Neophaeococcomyces mojaviensis]|uniref:Uncharacterized protein n=1 Tax=Neophaeococcomyces mojaviensis TaxID=3383035 RepID=A0ACC3AC51_9EURO|nr:hypothetical protein H2198_003365 [Knufia sp. JES_112]